MQEKTDEILTAAREVVARPDKDADKDASTSRLCLIAGIWGLMGVSAAYWNPVKNKIANKIDAVGSVDMVRLSLRFFRDGAAKIDAMAETFSADEVKGYTARVRPGGWHYLWTWSLGDSSVTCGIGYTTKGCRIDMCRGFLEFNPNKTTADPRFWRLLEKLQPHVAAASLQRWDLALDMPLPRNDVRLGKDGRKYEVTICGSTTEYLGQRSCAGRVKLYDKAAELGAADGDLTRVELTCDGTWHVEDIMRHWPRVYAWTSDESTRDWVRVVGLLLAEKAERGEEVESYLNMLGKRTRPQVREALQASTVELPEPMAVLLLNEAQSWARYFDAGGAGFPQPAKRLGG